MQTDLALLVVLGIAGISSTTATLPEGPLILGYATVCSEQGVHNSASHIITEAERGVNVIIWFSINLGKDSQGAQQVSFEMNTTCIASVARRLREKGLDTTHLISIGGWDAPHPDTDFNGEQWWAYFKQWNKQVVAKPELEFTGFDGIDWDLEGNDDMESQWNTFTVACLDLVGTMSQAAKKDGYVVTMVPPQSYLDPGTNGFDRSLNHTYPDYHPEFEYHGMNVYAALLTKYGKWDGEYGNGKTFDLVDVQLYESWSRADFFITNQSVPASEYLRRMVKSYLQGWEVQFGEDPDIELPTQTVQISASQLVIGFSFGFGSGKSVYITPDSFGEAYLGLPEELRPRGAMFWNLGLDVETFNGTSTKRSMAAGLNEFLHVR